MRILFCFLISFVFHDIQMIISVAMLYLRVGNDLFEAA